MPTDRPDLAALADRLEQAWQESVGSDEHATTLTLVAGEFLAARRAYRDAGCVECLVSREAVEQLRHARALSEDLTTDEYGAACEQVCGMLFDDLGDVLKAVQ